MKLTESKEEKRIGGGEIKRVRKTFKQENENQEKLI